MIIGIMAHLTPKCTRGKIMGREFMDNRYTHWFWNSNFIMWVARKTGRFNSWLWYMQYGREGAKKST
mgnify:FL=1